MLNCNCGSKSDRLHNVNCPASVRREQGILKTLKEKLLLNPALVMFYVTNTEQDCVNRANEYRKLLLPEDFIFEMELFSVSTFSMAGYSELTFLPQGECLQLVDLPNNTFICLENFPGYQDVQARLQTTSVEKISIVDTVTNQIL